MGRFHDFLVSMGLSAKCNLIGMSWGGFFSLRYAGTFPERIAAIYLDAPLCNAADPASPDSDRANSILENYKMSFEELSVSKLNPLNNVEALVNARIPMKAAVGETDQSVNNDTNFNILEKKIIELGGSITTTRRNYWGHHPHGFDDTEELLAFHCAAREE
jgi:pimeloyl-ACP methyl ester carboxylesterase